MENEENKSCDDELKEYLARNLVGSKLHVSDMRQTKNQLLFVVLVLIVVVLACVGGFAATVFFITKEQSKQVELIFDSNWEKEISHVYQDAGSGELNNSVINHNSNDNTNTITVTATPKSK